MIAIPITAHLLLMLCMAWVEARTDAADIAKHHAIDHPSQWQERAGFALVFALLFSFVGWAWCGAHFLAMMLGLMVVSYGAFTPAFRWLLNRARGKAWDYVSLSNLYDTAFIAIAGEGAAQLAYVVECAALVLGGYIATL